MERGTIDQAAEFAEGRSIGAVEEETVRPNQ
jgi:hypothetical protein